MIKYAALLCILPIVLLLTACDNHVTDKDLTTTTNWENEIDNYVQHLQTRQGIPGIDLTIIKNGDVIYDQQYGMANLEHEVPLSDSAIFRVYSLTKPIVAVGLFQLIEQGKLSLEDPVGKYLKDIPAAWQDIQLKYLLTHSSGLPDMSPFPVFEGLNEEEAKNKVFVEPVQSSLGEKFVYNQTNFWLLRRIIAQISEQSFEDFILQGQFAFDPQHQQVFFSSDSREIVKNRVTPYFYFRTGELIIDHSYGDPYMHAANGLNITATAFTKWNQLFANNQLITATSKDKMWQLFPYANDDMQFTYGWQQTMVNDHVSYGFSGSLVTAYRIFPDDDISIIFLSNGLEKWYNIDNIINHIASLVEENILDKNNLAFESLLQAAMAKDGNNIEKTYQDLQNDEKYARINYEVVLNDVGYFLLNLEKTELAVSVFQFNNEQYPASWNTFDSLAEAQERHGNIESALKNYRQALAMNTNDRNDYNGTLQKKIQDLEQRLEMN